jgi:hypothetical protein
MNGSFWAPCPLASFLRGAFSLATMSHFFLLALHAAFPRLAFHLWSA